MIRGLNKWPKKYTNHIERTYYVVKNKDGMYLTSNGYTALSPEYAMQFMDITKARKAIN